MNHTPQRLLWKIWYLKFRNYVAQPYFLFKVSSICSVSIFVDFANEKKKKKGKSKVQNRWLHPSLLPSEYIWIIMKAFIFYAFILYPSPSWKSYIRLVRVMKNAAWIMKAEQYPILPYIHKVNRGIIFSLLIFKWRNWFVLDTAWLSTDWQKCFIYQYLYKNSKLKKQLRNVKKFNNSFDHLIAVFPLTGGPGA